MRFLSWHFLENGPAGVGILSRGTRTVFSMGYDTMSPRYYQFLFREVASQPLVDQNQVCFCRQRSREGVPLSCIEHEKPGVGRRAGNDVDLRVASFAEVGPSFSGVAGCRLGVASCLLLVASWSFLETFIPFSMGSSWLAIFSERRRREMGEDW